MTEQLFEQLVMSILECFFSPKIYFGVSFIDFLLLAKLCMNLSAIKRSD